MVDFSLIRRMYLKVRVIPLNSEILKENAIQRYGQLIIPQVKDMIRDVILFCSQHKNLLITDMRIAKNDIQSAYTKFSWFVDSCYLMCVRIDNDLIYIPFNGNGTLPFINQIS